MQNKMFFLGAILSLILISFFGWKHYTDLEPYHLILATGNKQGNYYPFGKAIAQIVAQQNPKIKIKVIETSGANENMKLLQDNKVQLILAQSDTEAVPSAMMIASAYREVFQLIVAENSGIKTMSDLPGKRIALMKKGSGSYKSFLFLMEHYGFAPNDLKLVSVSWGEAIHLLSQGEVDAVFHVLPAGNNLVRDFLENHSGQLVPIDQGKAIKLRQPYLYADFIPRGTYKGNPPIPQEDLPTVGVEANLLVHEDVDPKVVQEIARILFEYRRDLVSINPLAAAIDKPAKQGKPTLPIHPGAQSYYDREKPNVLKANTNVIGLFLSIGSLVASWVFKLKTQLSKKKKNRADRYNLEIISLIHQARQEKDLEKIEEFQSQLFEIFQEIIDDLGNDRIAPESFQSFTFTWETALQILRDREIFLIETRYAKDKHTRLQSFLNTGKTES